jgi:hypothetical protein
MPYMLFYCSGSRRTCFYCAPAHLAIILMHITWQRPTPYMPYITAAHAVHVYCAPAHLADILVHTTWQRHTRDSVHALHCSGTRRTCSCMLVHATLVDCSVTLCHTCINFQISVHTELSPYPTISSRTTKVSYT